MDLFRLLFLPGTVAHELAHLCVILLMPNVSPTEVALTSHVKHEGQYTIARAVCISFAPLVVLTGLSIIAFHTVFYWQVASTAGSVLLLYLGFVLAVRALPSHADTKSPLSIARAQLGTSRWAVTLVLLPLYAIPLVTLAILTAVKEAVPQLNRLVNVAYGVGVFAVIYLGLHIQMTTTVLEVV